MKGSTLTQAVGVAFLLVHGILVLCPMPESVSHMGHELAFVAECAWVLWENRDEVDRLRAVISLKTRRIATARSAGGTASSPGRC
jgi:hypothetical protein